MDKDNNTSFLNLKLHQYEEDILIKYRDRYDAYECLNTQKNISPYFCYKYLYDSTEKYGDSADNWVSYSDISVKFSNNFTEQELIEQFKRAIDEKY